MDAVAGWRSGLLVLFERGVLGLGWAWAWAWAWAWGRMDK